MCCYNCAEYLDSAITSIIDQTYQNWELIISDDASTDNSIAIIQPYLSDKRILLHAHTENKGYVKNKNWALKQATGELVTQLDSDDLSKKERIEKQVNTFLANPDLKMCGTNYELIDMKGDFLKANSYKEDFMITTPELEYPFWFPGLMCRKEVFDEFGYFSEYFDGIYGDDHYWTLTVVNKYPIYFIKDVLYSYRTNPNSITNVFNNPRKMFSQDVIAELCRQIKETGTDWLQQGYVEKMEAYEAGLLNDKKLVAERYRVWAAKSIDNGQWAQAKNLLNNHFKNNKTDIQGYKTFAYYLRKRYLNA